MVTKKPVSKSKNNKVPKSIRRKAKKYKVKLTRKVTRKSSNGKKVIKRVLKPVKVIMRQIRNAIKRIKKTLKRKMSLKKKSLKLRKTARKFGIRTRTKVVKNRGILGFGKKHGYRKVSDKVLKKRVNKMSMGKGKRRFGMHENYNILKDYYGYFPKVKVREFENGNEFQSYLIKNTDEILGNNRKIIDINDTAIIEFEKKFELDKTLLDEKMNKEIILSVDNKPVRTCYPAIMMVFVENKKYINKLDDSRIIHMPLLKVLEIYNRGTKIKDDIEIPTQETVMFGYTNDGTASEKIEKNQMDMLYSSNKNKLFENAIIEEVFNNEKNLENKIKKIDVYEPILVSGPSGTSPFKDMLNIYYTYPCVAIIDNINDLNIIGKDKKFILVKEYKKGNLDKIILWYLYKHEHGVVANNNITQFVSNYLSNLTNNEKIEFKKMEKDETYNYYNNINNFFYNNTFIEKNIVNNLNNLETHIKRVVQDQVQSKKGAASLNSTGIAMSINNMYN